MYLPTSKVIIISNDNDIIIISMIIPDNNGEGMSKQFRKDVRNFKVKRVKAIWRAPEESKMKKKVKELKAEGIQQKLVK